MQLSRIIRGAASAAALVVASASCAGGADEGAAPVAEVGTGLVTTAGPPFGGPYAPLPQQPIATLSAAEVANIMAVLNKGEADQARVALARATSPDVRAFAAWMADEHTPAQARAEAIAQRLGSVPGTDPTSLHLLRENALLTADLESVRGPAFDLSYMTGQISAHAKVLGLIDHALVPSARRAGAADLDAELQTMRPMIVRHTVRALDLQNVLRGGNAVDRPLF